MIAHRETRIVPYTADLMYRVVADVERYPEFLPWVTGLRILSRGDERLLAEMAVGYGALRERYTSEVRLDPEARRIDVVQVKGPFKTLENHWRFTPKGPENGIERCEIEFSIGFEFKNRVLAKVAGNAFEKVMLKLADAFVARAAALSKKNALSPNRPPGRNRAFIMSSSAAFTVAKAHFTAPDVAEIIMRHSRCTVVAAFARHRDMHQPDRLFRRAAAGPGDAGDRDRHMSAARVSQCTIRHRCGDFRRYRAMLLRLMQFAAARPATAPSLRWNR